MLANEFLGKPIKFADSGTIGGPALAGLGENALRFSVM